jgi:hypothetical protein
VDERVGSTARVGEVWTLVLKFPDFTPLPPSLDDSLSARAKDSKMLKTETFEAGMLMKTKESISASQSFERMVRSPHCPIPEPCPLHQFPGFTHPELRRV